MTDNLSAPKPFTIPGGTDFNSLVQPGTYQLLWYDATAQNTPSGGNACQLAVSRIAENVILQTCTVWRGGLVYETYQRIREAGTWTAWDKLGPGEYHPGDSISFNEIAIPGFITTSTTCMYLMFPLDKPISSAVKSITATGKLTIRGVNGYVEGSSGKQFSDYDIYIVRTQSCIGLRLTKGSALEGATNNTPFGAWIQDATFTFN